MTTKPLSNPVVAASSKLQICCVFGKNQSNALAVSIGSILPTERYHLAIVSSLDELSSLLSNKDTVQDCLVLWYERREMIQRLTELEIFLPIVLLLPDDSLLRPSEQNLHTDPEGGFDITSVIVPLALERLEKLPETIDQAITSFLAISPQVRSFTLPDMAHPPIAMSLVLQQKRLSEKLNERLGYLGVYYKRDPRQFLRHMSTDDKLAYLDHLKHIYRAIVLEYFQDHTESLNQKIDEFVNLAFFADVSVSQVLEIHMVLMDEFSQQLKIEGRNDDILLDYRITLIDIIAHLCEMYRRSIPRES